MKNMKLSTKISVGFGLLIVIAMALGGMAVYNMNSVAGHTVDMKEKYVAEVAILSQLERRSQRTMYNMRGYAMSEDTNYLKMGKKDLELVKKITGRGQATGGQIHGTGQAARQCGQIPGDGCGIRATGRQDRCRQQKTGRPACPDGPGGRKLHEKLQRLPFRAEE